MILIQSEIQVYIYVIGEQHVNLCSKTEQFSSPIYVTAIPSIVCGQLQKL